MSEYQYYEFQAIDRPLRAEDRQALRATSSRAQITATSLTNTYEWGDFKGDPVKLMSRYFDLHLHLANWGSRRLMIRLPKRAIDRDELDRFAGEVDDVELHAAGDNVILDISVAEVDPGEWDDGTGWLASLTPLRADIASGDLRMLYLLWLMAVQADLLRPDALEPLPGIGPMTGALEAFVAFFDIDRDLVAAAAEQSPYAAADETTRANAARALIDGLGDAVKTGLLLRLWQGDAQVGNELRTMVRQSQAAQAAEGSAAARTAGTLRARAEEIGESRLRAAARKAEAERRRREEAAAQARQARLDALARRGDSVWREVETEIERRNATAYDRATDLLLALKAVSEEKGTLSDFSGRLRAIRTRHAAKGRFIERLAVLGQGDGAMV